jgi:alkylation response protein AidB-like acyl-CoA dehydrogenase
VEFELSPEHREVRALARDFAEAEIEPHASEWDRARVIARSILCLREPARAGA